MVKSKLSCPNGQYMLVASHTWQSVNQNVAHARGESKRCKFGLQRLFLVVMMIMRMGCEA